MSRPDWTVPREYKLGERFAWRGVPLVCCRAHYAGEAAVHPWDPGWGWAAGKAATLWAPDGDVAEARLVVEVTRFNARNPEEAERLVQVMRELTRVFPEPEPS